MIQLAITDHLEGPRERPSAEVYGEVRELIRIADRLGASHFFFAEHHVHLHQGHLPTPLVFAIDCAARTSRIQLGTAVICLNLHIALDVAEQVAVADVLMEGRLCAGFGSGSTPEEAVLFGRAETGEAQRHSDYREALRVIFETWQNEGALPWPRGDLRGRCWSAVNSAGAAKVAGELRMNVLFSHLRTPEQYRQYSAAYREAGGTGLIAANRPVFVGADDASAFAEAEPALRMLWRRFRDEGKIAATAAEPKDVRELCRHPINFIVGGPETVAQELLTLHRESPFDLANLEVRWAGLSHAAVSESLTRLLQDVPPLLSWHGLPAHVGDSTNRHPK
jgi:alkanesulfonate monooxygenase SsuD/methylene tetrahydromethanopterin reductase-like flavin-dependent oxidoreductase (luciferase family)